MLPHLDSVIVDVVNGGFHGWDTDYKLTGKTS